MSGSQPSDPLDPISPKNPLRAGRREWAALVFIALAVLLIAIDGTVLSLAIPFISADLQPTSTQMLWIVDIYSFVLAGLLVTMGTLGDRIGRRRLLLIGAAGFGAASALIAFAPTAELLIAARALLGIAGATLLPSTLSLIRNIFTDPRQRTLAIGVWSAMAAGGAAAGPILGGILLEHFPWGSVFLINIPVMALLLIAGPWTIPESKNPDPGHFDVWSAILSLAAVLPVVYGIKNIVEQGPSTLLLMIMAAGFLAGTVFVRRQKRLTHPMLDMRLFKNRMFSGAVLTNLLTIFAFVGLLYFGSQYLQLVLALAPLEAGLALLPGMIASLLGSLLAAPLVQRIQLHRLVATGLLLAASGFFLLTQVPVAGTPLLFETAFILVGAGLGVVVALTNDTIVSAVPAERAGAASAVSETAYELGTALGTAILGTILAASYRAGLDFSSLTNTPQADSTRENARESISSALTTAADLPDNSAQTLIDLARTAFTQAVHTTSWVALGILLICAALALFVLRATPHTEDTGTP